MNFSGAAGGDGALPPGEAGPTSQWGWPIGCDQGNASGYPEFRMFSQMRAQHAEQMQGQLQLCELEKAGHFPAPAKRRKVEQLQQTAFWTPSGSGGQQCSRPAPTRGFFWVSPG